MPWANRRSDIHILSNTKTHDHPYKQLPLRLLFPYAAPPALPIAAAAAAAASSYSSQHEQLLQQYQRSLAAAWSTTLGLADMALPGASDLLEKGGDPSYTYLPKDSLTRTFFSPSRPLPGAGPALGRPPAAGQQEKMAAAPGDSRAGRPKTPRGRRGKRAPPPLLLLLLLLVLWRGPLWLRGGAGAGTGMHAVRLASASIDCASESIDRFDFNSTIHFPPTNTTGSSRWRSPRS